MSNTFPSGLIGDVVSFNYRRRLSGTRESWHDLCIRTIDGIAKLGKFTDEEKELVFKLQKELKTLTSGRWLWVGGTEWIDKPENFAGAYNCQSSNMIDWAAFGYAMNFAMMGTGTGGVLEDKYISQLPIIRNRLSVKVVGEIGAVAKQDRQEDTLFIADDEGHPTITITVGDSRKGWVTAYQAMLELSTADTLWKHLDVTVDISNVRPNGEKLKGFGGTANPIKLAGLFPKLANITNKAIGRKLTSVECCLIMDEAALVVVAGNVRRCLPEDALVHTDKGYIAIKDINVGDLVQTPLGLRKVLNKFDQGVQEVFRIETPTDVKPRATANHRVAVICPDKQSDFAWRVKGGEVADLNSIFWKPVSGLSENDLLVHRFDALSSDSFVIVHEDLPCVAGEIKSIGDIQTYDIEVEDAHCFYCDGFLTHNSAGMRQFSSTDKIAEVAKENLWQCIDGAWKIDPERDALRMANHTRVFHQKPSQDEVLSSVRKQYYSGEGAIQWAGEAIARSNADLLDTEEKKQTFLTKYSRTEYEARIYLSQLGWHEPDKKELDHRMSRYGLNPCFAEGTMVLTRNGDFPIESLVGQTVDIFDGREWRTIDNFRVTAENQPVYKLTLHSGMEVTATEYHKFILEDGSRVELKDLKVGNRLWGIFFKPIPESDYDYGFNQPSPNNYTVKSVEFSHVADKVYCCTVEGSHSFTLADGLVVGQCGEILGSSFFCNLSEVHLNRLDPHNHNEQDEAFRAATLSVCALLHHNLSALGDRFAYSREIDPIIGVSFTGLFDFFVNLFGRDWLDWWAAGRPEYWGAIECCEDLQIYEGMEPYWKSHRFKLTEARYLQKWRETVETTAREYCLRHNLKLPNRCTTVQPSGSKSLLTGASAGWHPSYAPYFIRRVTKAVNDPVALAAIALGYSVVPAQTDKDENGNLLTDPHDPRCTEWLIEIPYAMPWADVADGIDFNFSALAQFDFYMQVQQHYTTHNCFSRDTRFLTDKGVLDFYQFEEGDTVTVLNKDGEWVPATVVKTQDSRPMKQITIREGRSGRTKTITSTLCHRFPVKKINAGNCLPKIVEAKDLLIGHRLVLNSMDFDLISLDNVGIQHGICFGDGSVYKTKKGTLSGCQVYLCSAKRLLVSYFDGYSIIDRIDIDQYRIYGLPVAFKTLPDPDCTQSYLAGFVAGLLATDGNISGSTINISTIRQDVVDFLVEQLPRIGLKVTSAKAYQGGGYSSSTNCFDVLISKSSFPPNLILRDHHLSHFEARESQPSQWKVIELLDLEATEEGWCVMEPKTNHFTLEDNILVMNTSATISLRESEIEPLANAIYESIQNDTGYISAALLARFDENQTFPRLPFEAIDKATYERLSSDVKERATMADFGEALALYDNGKEYSPEVKACEGVKCELGSAIDEAKQAAMGFEVELL